MAKPVEPPLERIRQETESNQQAFERLRGNFTRHEGSYALMKSGLILDFFPNSKAAMLAGHERCLDRVFSIHRVRAHDTNRPHTIFRPIQDFGGARA